MELLPQDTVVLDSDWVSDGHSICWNNASGFVGHTDDCPYYTEGKQRVYLCSPGQWAYNNGISLSDLPDEQAAACRKSNFGSEEIRWRLVEFLSERLTIPEETEMSIFEMELDD